MSLVKLLKKKVKKILFTTPSHGQKLALYKPLKNMYQFDISEADAYNPQAELLRAEEQARKIYKTNATFFLTNGSTSGIIAAVLTCVNAGDKVLIWENAHKCHLNAVKLAGAFPVFYKLILDDKWGIPLETEAEMLEYYLNNNEIKAVIVTSPTYEGIVSDMYRIKKICEKHGAYLIADEAHGALYPFSKRLPESSVHIADFTVQSLHKTAGGLNPTALLHVNCNLDAKKGLEMINTTSPSYPILASIEENIKYLNSWWGKRKLEQLLDSLENLREDCTECEFFGDDITKIIVRVDGMSGFELSEVLYEDFDIEDEKTNEKSTMLLCGVGTDKKKILKLKQALQKISQ